MDTHENGTKKFHGWRLIGVIMVVMVVLAIISALVDWVAIG
jgi:type II secretory pathway component PulK